MRLLLQSTLCNQAWWRNVSYWPLARPLFETANRKRSRNQVWLHWVCCSSNCCPVWTAIIELLSLWIKNPLRKNVCYILICMVKTRKIVLIFTWIWTKITLYITRKQFTVLRNTSAYPAVLTLVLWYLIH